MEKVDYSRKYTSLYKEAIFKLNDDGDELIEIEEKIDEKYFNLTNKNEKLEIKYEKLEERTLVEKIETIFSEIHFSLDEKNDVDKLLNLELICSKWSKLMMKLLKEDLKTYEIEMVYEVLSLLERENDIKEILKDYYLFRYLFMGIYEVSSSKLVINKKKEIKDLFIGDILFDLKVEYLEDEREIKITGKEVMEHSYANCIKDLKERGYISSKEMGELKFLLNGKYLLNEDNSVKDGEVSIIVRYHKREVGKEGKVLLEIKHLFNIKEV